VATLAETIARFGRGSAQRIVLTDRLRQIHELALATGCLDRLVIFGSYVSNVNAPNDIDVILIMRNEFRSEECPPKSAVLFDHARGIMN
jgi:hypothetical protein